MEDKADVLDGSHPGEKPANDRVSEEKRDKSELARSDEAREAEEIFEEAIDSQEELAEQVLQPESFVSGGVHEDSATEDSKGEHEVDNFEEARGAVDETSSIEEDTKDFKVENLVDTNLATENSKGNGQVDDFVEAISTLGDMSNNEEDSKDSRIGNLVDDEVATGNSKGDNDKMDDFEEATGATNNNEEDTKDLKVEILVDVPNTSDLREVEAEFFTPEINGDKGESNVGENQDAEISNGQVEGQLDVVEDHEKVDATDSKSLFHNCGVENGVGINGEKELDPEVRSKDAESKEPTENGIEDGAEEKDNSYSLKGSVYKDNETGAQRNGEIGDHMKSNVNNSCGEQSSDICDSNEAKTEVKEHSNGLKPEAHLASPSSNPVSTEVESNNTVAEVKEKSEVRRESAASTPIRPAGLGRVAPPLEPAHRVPQQPRVNGSVSHTQAVQVEESAASAETGEHDETREQLQMIRVKFLRLAHRLGQTPHNVVVAQVLYRLGLAEQLRGRSGSRVGAFSFDRASAMAEQLEAAGQDPLDFSCTIMVIGKSGVGKSATINSIFDEVKFETDAFQMGTKRVQDVEGFVQGIKVRVIDTPGLLPSGSDQRQNEKILNSVKSFIKKTPPDIVLYLDRLDMQSRDSGDMPLLRTITDIFGPSIWFNAIVVLTHAASAPPDGPNGTASSYDMFVTQRSHVIQQAIRQAAGDMRLMNPVSLVENHSACRTNRAGQRVLPNGQVWKPHLLLLSFASKILAEANALLKLQDNTPGRPFAARSKAPPLPFLLSSLLQSRPHVKLPAEQYGDEDDGDDDLGESSDSEEESEYDQLPPFKRLTRAEMAKLSRAQKKQYLDELEYREKLFMKKQMKEERKRHKMMKKLAEEAKELPNEYNENVEDEESSVAPASVPVPMPDLALPASFDSDNPTHRYRYLDSSNQWLVRPVLETHGWDHDVGYEGVNVERLFAVKNKIPISFSGQVTKDKKDANVQAEITGSIKHGEGGSTSLGFDMQNVGKDLAYTLRSETRFNKFRRNKAAAGLSVTLLGDSVSAGVKVEDRLVASKWFRLVLSGGAMTSRGDVAYGGSLEAQLRDKEYPLGRFLSTLGLSVMDWHGDLAIGGNIQSQVPIGRSTNLIARANLNNRGAGQVSIRVNSSEQLQLALMALVPLFNKLLSYTQQMQYGQ